MIKEAIAKVVERENLTMTETEQVMGEIMSGEATPAQISAFLTALRMKGETASEIAGCARVMRENALRVTPKRTDVVDTCGTGGDASGTFNISTAVAFVVAGTGVGVAKHGNRSVSSKCGSADLMEALGIKISLSAEQVAQCIDEVGIGFLFAPGFHPAMKYATPVRQEIGLRTIFNVLGPLANPAWAKRQLIGVYSAQLVPTIAEVLRNMGTEHAFVVHGAGGLDELSTTGVNQVAELKDGEIHAFELAPTELGIPKANPQDLLGGTAQENIEIVKSVLGSEKGPKRDVVILNASAVLVAAGKTADLKEGLKIAAESIDSGRALDKVTQLAKISQGFA